ncbi:MAG: hypothetical protein LKE52_03475 [Bacilli bacterium]|jgi:ABC-type dipeptide/oligopeptide/nickel transport system permease component|nr:hypothetical protein [Bacilli bacterium]
MAKYVIKRILLAFVTLFIILSLTFILMKLLPFTKPLGTTSAQMAYYGKQVSLGYVLQVSEPIDNIGALLYKYTDSTNVTHYFYQRPIMEQYGNWVKNVITKWDWGVSYFHYGKCRCRSNHWLEASDYHRSQCYLRRPFRSSWGRRSVSGQP